MLQWLIAAGVPVTQARLFAEPLKAAMALFDISTIEQKSAFLAQATVESQNFTRMEENLRYTNPVRIAEIFRSGFDLDKDRKVDPEEVEFAKGFVRQPEKLANRAYANRNGNGDEASGDGWRYRGRGIFQITGRANYIRVSNGVGLGPVYVHKPDLVSQPSDACMSAAYYWQSNGCNQMVDRGAFNLTTKIINGPAMLHASERLMAFSEFMEAHSEVLA